jgi:hypothetical protein
MNRIKFAGMYMIFHCTKLNLCKYNSWWAIFITWNVNFNFILPAMIYFCFYFFRKSGLIKSCSSLEDLSVLKISCSGVDSCYFCIHLGSMTIPLTPCSKVQTKTIVIQTKLVARSMILHCTKRRLSKCNGSWVISIKQNVHLKFQLHLQCNVRNFFLQKWSY